LWRLLLLFLLSRLLVALLLATLSGILLLLTRLLILLAALVLLATLVWIAHVIASIGVEVVKSSRRVQSPLGDDLSACAYLKRMATTNGCAVQTTANRS
jgi:hypothetical protein